MNAASMEDGYWSVPWTFANEALETGAEVLATACPFCLINFEDAVKVLDKEDAIAVKDISEILLEAMVT
jgi:Fe-S oxidoreductase